jgi:hypothetical protein
VAVLFLALATGFIVNKRRVIAMTLLLGEIHEAGIEDASLVVEAVGIGALSLTDIRIGEPPALEIARIDARYSTANLWNGFLDELLVSGLRLHASFGEDGLSLGALDALLEGDSEGAAGLPARKIVVTDARAELEAPGGDVSFPFQIGIDDRGDGELEGEASFEVRHPLAEASGRASIAGTPDDFEGTLRIRGSPLATRDLRIDSEIQADARFWLREGGFEAEADLNTVPVYIAGDLLRAEGETPEVRLQLQRPAESSAFRIDLQTRGGRLELADYELSVAEIGLRARLEGDSGEGSLRVGELRDLQRPARVQPLGLRGNFEIRDSTVEFQAKLASPGENLMLEVSGSADPNAPSATAALHLHPLVWGEGGIQPATLFPFLKGQIEGMRGTVEAAGTASWDGDRAAGEIDLALRELGFAAGPAEVSMANGLIEIRWASPAFTPPGQLVSIALLDIGLELTAGVIEFQLRPDGDLDLEQAEWQWAGGSLRTAGRFDPMADSQEAVLEVDDVDLAELLALVDLEGLEGTGTLEGEIPIFRSGETLEVRQGKLQSTPEGGRIRYRSASAARVLANQGYGLEQLLGALDDFHYDVLEIGVGGDTRGEVNVAIQLGGFNPNFQRGRRVEINLNVEARLADLLRAGLVAYRVPEAVLKRLEKFQVPEVP